MGQILSWIRGPRDSPALHDVAVEEQIHGNYRPLPLPRKDFYQSQPGQATPKPAAQASTVKPAQFEKASSGSAMATKPGVVSTATGGATRSGVTTRGNTSIAAAGKVAATARTETNTTPAGATVIDMSSAGGTVVDMTTAGSRGGPKQMSKAAPASQVTATATVHSPAAGLAATKPKDTAKSATAVTTLKPDLPKVDPAKTSNVSVQEKKEESKPTQTKVQVEVPAAAAKGAKQAPAVDPFDALASILPSADAVVRPQPVYTGPEVKEHDITHEKGEKCGEKEETLPPGYRFEDMAPGPADVKPKDVPKPLSTDEALDALSGGFMTSTVPAAPKRQEKKEHVDSVSASSAAPANFAPPPVKKPQTPAAVPPVSVCPAPVDNKPKMEKVSCDFSLEAGLPSAPGKVCPPVDKKPKMEKVSDDFSLMAGLDTKVDPKPKTAMSNPVPLDALSALGDLLPVDAPKPDLPKLRPKDIVSEDKLKEKEGVLVGERDDTLPPEYRFNLEELKKLPAPNPEPSLGTGEALDILSGDFMLASAAPAVQAPPAQKASSVPPVPVCSAPVADAFSLEAGLSASTATKVKSSAVPPVAAGKDAVDGKLKKTDLTPVPMDALSALGDLLPVDAPKPDLPKLRPEDIVSEDKLKEKEGVLVGERDDTLPPEYRFNLEELKKLPAPKPEPSLGTGEALDILSGDFMLASAAPAVQAPPAQPNFGDCTFYPAAPAREAPVPTFSVLPAQTTVQDLSALDFLSQDIVAPTKASGVQAPVPPPARKAPEKMVCPLQQPSQFDIIQGQPRQPPPKKNDPVPMDALSALGDLLPVDAPKPDLPKLRPEDIFSEDKLKEKEGVLVGERDDTLPPEYRFNLEELKKIPAPKPEPTMDTGDALDILSGDFTRPSAAAVVQAPVVTPSAPPAEASADFALDALAGDFVCTAAPAQAVKSACPPTEVARQLSGGTDSALDALSDTLKDITPTPQPAPVPTKDLVKEKKVVEEKLIKMGERDDSLPPEYRPTEEDLKKMKEAAAKDAAKPKEKKMDNKTAIDLLAGAFDTAPEAAAPVASSAATTKLEAVLDSDPLKPMAGPVLDSLAGSLLPDAPEFKPKADKPKGKSKSKSRSKKHHAEEPCGADQLPAQQRSDLVPTTKGGKS